LNSNLSIQILNSHLYIKKDNNTTDIALSDLLKPLKLNSGYNKVPNNKMVYISKNAKIILNYITISEDNNISNMDGYLLLRN